ncbi:MAG TPA: hypothetical protein VEA36_03445 [Candidatus Paceibacterota bacterium]|nr:hypothetical protein [Candidatus Paceibacterota bacterium]
MGRRALVLWGEVPTRPPAWWREFDTVFARRTHTEVLEQLGVAYEDLDAILDPGSIFEATDMVRALARITLPDGSRLAKSVLYKGYELWWIHYDDLHLKFCLPFTQYEPLLKALTAYEEVHSYNPPSSTLFGYYLEAHGVRYEAIDDPSPDRLPFGMVLQIILSLPFLIALMIRRPGLMLWTSDRFDPPRDHDFRTRFLYEELHNRRIPFVEFIRSQETWKTMLEHAKVRRRPVIYSHAITTALRLLAGVLVKKDDHRVRALVTQQGGTPEETFRFLLATHYLRNVTGDIWAIRAMQLVLWAIGIRAAYVPAALSRNFHEVLAAKRSRIPIIGILHGVSSKSYNVYDFMPEYDGTLSLSVDRYGLWSPWWREYYLENSKVYKPEQLAVSGPMRPVERGSLPEKKAERTPGEPIKVLFIAEQLGIPKEILPYLTALLDAPDLSFHMKVRSYKDGFEEWLAANRPDLIERMDQERIFRGGMNEAIAACDVVVGSHSTAVLESLLQLKPCIFYDTKKWGDYFDLRSFRSDHKLIGDTPEEFLGLVRQATDIPEATLKELQYRFFGDPYENGSAWVVDELAKRL